MAPLGGCVLWDRYLDARYGDCHVGGARNNSSLIACMGVLYCHGHANSFPRVKVLYDVSSVLFALVLSVFLLHRVEGVREGTVAASLLVGVVVAHTLPRMRRRE